MDTQLIERIRQSVSALVPGMIELRRALHAHPELGLETPRTARTIRDRLAGTSLALREPLIGNDVIAELNVGAKRTICLRADIDALPITEESSLAYRSTVNGLMHACGHDGHTAMLVGAALALDSLRDRLSTNVRFVFQPGEELLCAGKELISRGALDGCEAAYAIHSWPGLPVGAVSTREGALFAAGSHFTITLRGRGCHGALPERGNNPIPAAASLVRELHDLHKRVNGQDGAVVSVCSVQSGTSSNIIPDTAIVQGTARYLSTDRGHLIEGEIIGIVERCAAEWGVGAALDSHREYDTPVINSPLGYRAVRDAAVELLQPGMWIDANKPSMTMDDFAFYLKGREGAMLLLGMGEDSPNLHSPTFDFADDALETGMLMLCALALHPHAA